MDGAADGASNNSSKEVLPHLQTYQYPGHIVSLFLLLKLRDLYLVYKSPPIFKGIRSKNYRKLKTVDSSEPPV